MSEVERLALIDNKTTILMDRIGEADDGVKKALLLINDLRERYDFSIGARPSKDLPGKLKIACDPDSNDAMHNAMVWTCHYETIMLRLDMIEDFLINSAKGAAAAEAATNEIIDASGF